MKLIPVLAMPPEEHYVQGHSSHQGEVVVLVDGQDTKCGTFQVEAYAQEEWLEERIDTLGVEEAAEKVEEGVKEQAAEEVDQALRRHPHERHNSSK
jgi:hypothetical protein